MHHLQTDAGANNLENVLVSKSITATNKWSAKEPKMQMIRTLLLASEGTRSESSKIEME